MAEDEGKQPEGDAAEAKPASASGAAGATAGSGPSEEELRAQLEEEIRKVRVEDVVLQSAVSILNLAARRIAKDDERDLAQAKVGIDAARALTELCTEDARPQLRQAVSELQVLYAKHAGEGEGEAGEPAEKPAPEAKGAKTEGKGGEGKGDSPLWTPGS